MVATTSTRCWREDCNNSPLSRDPKGSADLATIFLGEKLRPAHYPALALVAIGVVIPFVAAGSFTWIAVALPITFGFYGLVRKKVPVESLTGLTVETLLLLPPSLGFLI